MLFFPHTKKPKISLKILIAKPRKSRDFLFFYKIKHAKIPLFVFSHKFLCHFPTIAHNFLTFPTKKHLLYIIYQYFCRKKQTTTTPKPKAQSSKPPKKHTDMKIAVYCSSRTGLPEEYTRAAEAVGQWIGNNGHSLIYGGVNAGLMHSVALAASSAGAEVTGIVPHFFTYRADPLVDNLIECTDLSDRKALMIRNADAFVVLPGGLGTIDEWMSTLSQLVVNCDRHRKIVVANIGGIFNPTITQIAQLAASPLARSEMMQMSVIARSCNETIDILNKISQPNK